MTKRFFCYVPLSPLSLCPYLPNPMLTPEDRGLRLYSCSLNAFNPIFIG